MEDDGSCVALSRRNDRTNDDVRNGDEACSKKDGTIQVRRKAGKAFSIRKILSTDARLKSESRVNALQTVFMSRPREPTDTPLRTKLAKFIDATTRGLNT